MLKRILSLDLGVTSIGYSVLEEKENDKYSLLDYGVSMFDAPYNKDGNSKKLLHSQNASTSKLYHLRKKRKKDLAKLFEKFKLGKSEEFLKQEKQNRYKHKWELRGKEVFERKLDISELFTIFYFLAKHRGYKSLDSSDLLEELIEKLGLSKEEKKSKKDDEKGKIKQALRTIEDLKQKFPEKTVASIIYMIEMQKSNPTFRNHDNYNYMIRREYINEEIEKILNIQKEFGLFDKSFELDEFTKELKEIITVQKESTNDLSLFGKCEFYPEYKVAHQYSLLSDIYKMYQAVSNITFDKSKTKIKKEQIQKVANFFLKKIKSGKKISDIKYKDIRAILNLDDAVKIFNKEDNYLRKGKKQENTIVKFHFVSNLAKFDNSFILKAFEKENPYRELKEIFDVLHEEKSPKSIYEKLKDKVDKKTIIELIKNKSGNSLNISSEAIIKCIPYFEDGLTLDEIKQKLDLKRSEDYSSFKKGIKYLHVNQFEKDDKLEINNHPVKSIVSITLRLIKYLHAIYGNFDEIKVESTRELSQNEQIKEDIKKANRDLEKKIDEIVENTEYQNIANQYGKNLKKYARKLLMWEEQERLDIYSGESIGLADIFSNIVDLDHIVPQSLGGLSVKHNFVLVHRNSNLKKSNNLPINFISDKQGYINRVEHLFSEHKINWKKRKNLLAENLDEIYKDTFESKSLRATSYAEALTAQILKRYYPFTNKTKQKDGSAVKHIQGRATSNIRKLLHIKTKSRDTNIHHAIDAILIGVTNHSWLQKLSNTFRENFGVIDEVVRKNIKKAVPYIEGMELKDLVNEIEQNYNSYGEDSIFYKDIWGKTKAINFWVSRKPISSKIHKDTIYAKKPNGIFTVRENIINKFIALKITAKTKPEDFINKFEKDILKKMYLYKTNSNDVICKIVIQRAKDIQKLLVSFENLDTKDKEVMTDAKSKLNALIHSDLIDNNGNIIRKIKFVPKTSPKDGFDIRKGKAISEKTFIGFKTYLEKDKLKYNRIDISNTQKINGKFVVYSKGFKVFKNNLVFFIFSDGTYKGGKIVSFLADKGIAAFSNSKFPASIANQPHSFLTFFNGKPNSHKQHSINKAIGLIKLDLDILGNIKSQQTIGNVQSKLFDFIKEILK